VWPKIKQKSDFETIGCLDIVRKNEKIASYLAYNFNLGPRTLLSANLSYFHDHCLTQVLLPTPVAVSDGDGITTHSGGQECPPTYHIFTIIVSPKSSYQPLSLFPMAMG
jgi:hypothetical protein